MKLETLYEEIKDRLKYLPPESEVYINTMEKKASCIMNCEGKEGIIITDGGNLE